METARPIRTTSGTGDSARQKRSLYVNLPGLQKCTLPADKSFHERCSWRPGDRGNYAGHVPDCIVVLFALIKRQLYQIGISAAQLSISIVLLLLYLPLHAQGIRDSVFRIDPVEVAAQRSFQKEQAGMNEVRVDTFIMRYQGGSDLATLLQENTTIHIKDYGRGALSTASFRGTAPSHTQVTWNGMNINSPMLGMVDFTLVPLFLVDELKIQQGAASIAAQGGGLGGLIALENRPDFSNTFSGKAYAGIGSFVTSNAFTRVDIGNPRVQTRTRVYSNYSKNNYRFVNKNIIEKDTVTGELYHPEQENRDAAYRKLGLTQEMYFRLNERSVLSGRTWIQDATRSVPTVLSSEYSEEGLQRENLQNDRTLKHVVEFDTWREGTRVNLRSGVDYQLLDYSMKSEIAGREPVRSVNSGSRMMSWYNHAELQQDLSERISLRSSASLDRFGISTRDSANMTGYDTTRLEGSLMTGVYYSPVEPLQVALQVRKDMVTGYKTPLIYTVGVSARPFGDHDLLLKANFARNYHQPTLNDLFWQPGGNPDLLPEEGHTGEVSVSWLKKTETISVQTSLTGYFARIENWILWLPGFKGYWESANIREVRSYGMEYHLSSALLVGEWSLRLHGTLALTRTLNMDEEAGSGSVPGTGSGAGSAAGSGDGSGAGSADGSGAGSGSVSSTVSGSVSESVSESGSPGQQLPFIPKISGNVNAAVMRQGWFVIFQNNSMGARSLLSSSDGLSGSLTAESTVSIPEGTNSSTLTTAAVSAAPTSATVTSSTTETDNSNIRATATTSTTEGANSITWAAASGDERLYTLYPHFLNNISVGKRIEQPAGTFTLELKIENLFNESYRNVLMRFMPGRSFTLNLKYDF
ncbi:MAG: TonB-dependent receptor plug domain-containing protein [Bacteroidales bacterium]|nr:TonB-dependent receptor plug domain-containing protein [Bacteroidales bacterium]